MTLVAEPYTRCIAVSEIDMDRFAELAEYWGIRGYLGKDTSPAEITSPLRYPFSGSPCDIFYVLRDFMTHPRACLVSIKVSGPEEESEWRNFYRPEINGRLDEIAETVIDDENGIRPFELKFGDAKSLFEGFYRRYYFGKLSMKAREGFIITYQVHIPLSMKGDFSVKMLHNGSSRRRRIRGLWAPDGIVHS